MTSRAIFLSFISVGWTGFILTAIILPRLEYTFFRIISQAGFSAQIPHSQLVTFACNHFGFFLAEAQEAVGKVKAFWILSRGDAEIAKNAEFLSEFLLFS